MKEKNPKNAANYDEKLNEIVNEAACSPEFSEGCIIREDDDE